MTARCTTFFSPFARFAAVLVVLLPVPASALDLIPDFFKDTKLWITSLCVLRVKVVKGGLDCFIGKPWKPEQLQSECRRLLTDYVIHHCAGPELLSYSHSLDGQALYAALEARRLEL